MGPGAGATSSSWSGADRFDLLLGDRAPHDGDVQRGLATADLERPDLAVHRLDARRPERIEADEDFSGGGRRREPRRRVDRIAERREVVGRALRTGGTDERLAGMDGG